MTSIEVLKVKFTQMTGCFPVVVSESPVKITGQDRDNQFVFARSENGDITFYRKKIGEKDYEVFLQENSGISKFFKQ